MEIKINNLQYLINDVNDKITKGKPVVIYNSLDEVFDIMKLDIALMDYINMADFLKTLRDHNLIRWNKICFATKDNMIIFFKYLQRHS